MKPKWAGPGTGKVDKAWADSSAEFYIDYMIEHPEERFVFVNSADGAMFISRAPKTNILEVWDLRIKRMAVVHIAKKREVE